MFEPAVIPLEAYKNGVLRTQFTMTKDTSALDLTNYVIKMQVRAKPGDTVLAEASSAGPSADGSVITIISPTTGVFEVFMSNLDFQDVVLPPNFTAADALIVVYDILFKNPANNDWLPLIKGSFKIYAGVTVQ